MSNFQLKVKLKQHTPIIHFQHDQDGATLRATELKPKLDAYLLKKMGVVKKSLLVGAGKIDGQNALDYKVSIKGRTAERKEPKSTGIVGFFGNMKKPGEEKKDKFFVFDTEEIELVFFSFHSEIIREIRESISQFFATNNFGTRQSKGFGGFMVTSINGESIPLTLPDQRPSYYFDVETEDLSEWQAFEKVFRSIDLFYRTLRSGLNIKQVTGPPGNKITKDILYFKSLMFQYARREPHKHTWDKKEIRERLFKGHPRFEAVKKERPYDPESSLYYQGAEAYLYRDLLGLSSEESWYVYSKTVTKKSAVVERFKSPITFKVIRNAPQSFRIYILRNDTVKKYMLKKSFTVSGNGRSTPLSTPDDFDLEAYLKFCFSFFKGKGDNAVSIYVGSNKDKKTVDILQGIYFQLAKLV